MQFKVHIPFVELLGMALIRFEPGQCEIHQTLRDELTNSYGVAHGGVTMALLDVVMAHAARTPHEAGGEVLSGVVTIEMKTSFTRPGLGRLIATGKRLHGAASMAFCEGYVHDEMGLLVAHASGTFKYMKALPVGSGPDGRRIRKLNPPV